MQVDLYNGHKMVVVVVIALCKIEFVSCLLAIFCHQTYSIFLEVEYIHTCLLHRKSIQPTPTQPPILCQSIQICLNRMST